MTTSFEVLNDILIGEHMVIEQYQAYIDALPHSPLRNHLVTILTDHKQHAERLSYFIQMNGGHVQDGTGLAGKLALWRIKLENLRENHPLKMLEKLHNREDKGLARAVQLSSGKVMDSEKEILDKIFTDEREHLRQLERLREDLLQ